MDYRELEAWRRAMDLCVAIFEVAESFPYREGRALADQLRSAAISVPSNVGEAFGRFSYRDQRQFIIRSRGSLLEVETQVELARRLKFAPQPKAEQLFSDITQVARLLNGLIRYLSRRVAAESKRSNRAPKP